jgi:hypothetical protein
MLGFYMHRGIVSPVMARLRTQLANSKDDVASWPGPSRYAHFISKRRRESPCLRHTFFGELTNSSGIDMPHDSGKMNPNIVDEVGK